MKRTVSLRDGDQLVIHDDQPSTWEAGNRITVLIHGLGGSYSSPYMRRTSDKLQQNGIRTIRVDMRGAGESTLVSRSHFHAGIYEDIEDIVAFVHQLSPHSRMTLIGFSLGGNVVLKTLGEWGKNVPAYVDSAITVSPPVDLAFASANLRSRGNRLYEWYFMKKLKQQLVYRRRRVSGLIDNGLNPLPDRLVHFDDQFVAPVCGFRGARDYYAQASSGDLLHRIQIPTIVLSSVDDPIVPFEVFRRFSLGSFVELVSTQYGGHLGFLGKHPGDPDRFWLDWRLQQWVSRMK